MLAALLPNLGMGASDAAPDDAETPGLRLGLHYGPRRPNAHDDMTYAPGVTGSDTDDG